MEEEFDLNESIDKVVEWTKEADYILLGGFLFLFFFETFFFFILIKKKKAGAGVSIPAGVDYTSEKIFKEYYPAMHKVNFFYHYFYFYFIYIFISYFYFLFLFLFLF